MQTTDRLPDSFGGVVLDHQRRVLLRKPKGEFDGYVWTFPKGRQIGGEEPAATANRVTRVKSGYDAEVLGPITGVYRGGTSRVAYFIMQVVGDTPPGATGDTDEVLWCDQSQVAGPFLQTRNPVGRERDLAVWRAVQELLQRAMTRLSWENHPMPDRRDPLSLRLELSWEEMGRVAAGHLPQEMEDKWFVLFEHPWLSFNRSWTGFCIYCVRWAEFAGRWSISEAWVNRDPQQYTGTDAGWDERLIRHLLHSYFRAGEDPGWPD
jgi:ADP-ribose pyrophosphatase YjhB (NUDIX family)